MAVPAVDELSRHQEPEAHVVAKAATLHYAFYAAQWDGKVALRGLGREAGAGSFLSSADRVGNSPTAR
jgi:hypothetical protein